MSTMWLYVVNFAVALIAAPLLLGVVTRIKAKMAGRCGKPLLQVYYDLARLLRKNEVKGHTATWVFAVAPSIGLATTLCALALLPLGGVPSPIRFTGDVILAAYMLGMGRFAIMLAALDTGSSFEGMGASREAAFSALAEPLFFLAILVLVTLGWQTAADKSLMTHLQLSNLFGGSASGAWMTGRAELLLLPSIFLVLLLVENCRIPVDDPTTHLELTMIHEVMVLDHSGPNLAAIEYTAALKLWFFATLIAGLLVPPHLPYWQQTLFHLVSVFLVAATVGIVESCMARLRLVRVPQLLGCAAVLAGLVLLLTQVH